MKKKISICFFAGILLLCLLSVLLIDVYWDNKEKERAEQLVVQTEQTEELFESMAVVSNAAYYLEIQDGYVVVLESDHTTVYFETNIRYQMLPEEVKKQITEGVSFQNEAELFDFLESYSS